MEKTVKQNEILSFKMISGQEVVAEVISVNYEKCSMLQESIKTGPVVSYTVRRPHVLQFMGNPRGGATLVFVPWTLSNKEIERIDIPASGVLLTFSPSREVESQYLIETTGIDVTPRTTGRISS